MFLGSLIYLWLAITDSEPLFCPYIPLLQFVVIVVDLEIGTLPIKFIQFLSIGQLSFSSLGRFMFLILFPARES